MAQQFQSSDTQIGIPNKLRKGVFDLLTQTNDPRFVRFAAARDGYDTNEVDKYIQEYVSLKKPDSNQDQIKVDTGDKSKDSLLTGAIAQLKAIADISSKVNTESSDEGTKARISGVADTMRSKLGTDLVPFGSANYNDVRVLEGLKANVALISRAMGNTGNLSDTDIKSIQNALPGVGDTKEEAARKMQGFYDQINSVAGKPVIGPAHDEAVATSQGSGQQQDTHYNLDNFTKMKDWSAKNPDAPAAKKFSADLGAGKFDQATGMPVQQNAPGSIAGTLNPQNPLQSNGRQQQDNGLVDPATGEIKTKSWLDRISQPWAEASPTDSVGMAAAKTAANVIPSAISFGKGVVQFLNPLNTVETAQNIGNEAGQAIGSGEVSAGQLAVDTVKGLPGAAEHVLLPKFIQDLLNGDTKSAAATMENDPVGQIAPLLLAVKGIAESKGYGEQFNSAISNIAKPVTKVGEAAKDMAGTAVAAPTRFAVSQAVGISPETVSKIIADPQAFSKEAQATISRKGLADEIFGKLEERQKGLSETGAKYSPIREAGTVIPVEPTFLEDAIRKTTGLDIKDGKVVADTKSNFRDSADVKAIQHLYDNWNSKFTEAQMGADEFLNLRSDLAGLAKFGKEMGKSAPVEAATQRIRGMLNSQYRSQIDGLAELDRSHSLQRNEFDQLKKGLLDKNGELTPAAINRVANATGKGKDIIAQQLEDISPGITDKVKLLKAFEDIQSAGGIKPGTYVKAGGVGVGIMTGNIPLIVGSILAVPEMAVPILRGVGMAADKISPVLKILGLPGHLLNESPSLIPEVSSKETVPLKKGEGAIQKIAEVKTTAVSSHERAPGLSPEDRKIEDAAFSRIDSEGGKVLGAYTEKHGNVVNADNFRPYFKDQGYAGHNAASVQEPVSELSKRAYSEGLKKPGKYATLYAGGSGTGKTTAVKGLPTTNKILQDSSVVLDGNLSNYNSAVKKIREAEAAGKKTPIIYVYRDPVDSFVNGVVKRMRDNKDEMGRLVPAKIVAENHIGSWETVNRLYEEGKKGIYFIDNSLGGGKQKEVSFNEISKKIKYPSVEELTNTLKAEAKKLYDSGKITEKEYQGYIR